MTVVGKKVLLLVSAEQCERNDIPRRSRVIGRARNIWANVAEPPTRPMNLVTPIVMFLTTLVDLYRRFERYKLMTSERVKLTIQEVGNAS